MEYVFFWSLFFVLGIAMGIFRHQCYERKHSGMERSNFLEETELSQVGISTLQIFFND